MKKTYSSPATFCLHIASESLLAAQSPVARYDSGTITTNGTTPVPQNIYDESESDEDVGTLSKGNSWSFWDD